MKTAIKNLLTAAFTIVTLSTSAYAATGDQGKKLTVLSEVKNIDKIVANGNVEVILVQAPTESVKVYDSYYGKNALVQEENGVLRISSFRKETLTVAVYVRNLSAIEANGDAVIKTLRKVSFLSLDLKLKNNATAKIDATTLSLYTSVSDSATLQLSGGADEHYAVLGADAKMNMDRFNAASSSLVAANPANPIVAKVAVKKVEILPTDDYDYSK